MLHLSAPLRTLQPQWLKDSIEGGRVAIQNI